MPVFLMGITRWYINITKLCVEHRLNFREVTPSALEKEANIDLIAIDDFNIKYLVSTKG